MVSASVPSVGHDCAGNVLSLLTAFTTREAPLPAGASLSFRSISVLPPSPGARRCEQLRSMTCLFGGPELASPTLYCSCRCSGTWLPPSPLRGRSRTTWFDLGGSALMLSALLPGRRLRSPLLYFVRDSRGGTTGACRHPGTRHTPGHRPGRSRADPSVSTILKTIIAPGVQSEPAADCQPARHSAAA